MNISKKQKQTHRDGDQTCGCQRGVGERGNGLETGGWQFRVAKLQSPNIAQGAISNLLG